jgi:hypothetical protein
LWLEIIVWAQKAKRKDSSEQQADWPTLICSVRFFLSPLIHSVPFLFIRAFFSPGIAVGWAEPTVARAEAGVGGRSPPYDGSLGLMTAIVLCA